MKTDIMGIAFDNVSMQEALDKASAILRGDKTCYAVTPNAEIAYEALKDERLPLAEMGRHAVELLLKRIKGEAVESIILAPQLQVRASSGLRVAG